MNILVNGLSHESPVDLVRKDSQRQGTMNTDSMTRPSDATGLLKSSQHHNQPPQTSEILKQEASIRVLNENEGTPLSPTVINLQGENPAPEPIINKKIEPTKIAPNPVSLTELVESKMREVSHEISHKDDNNRLIYPNGDSYEGDLKDDGRHGFGCYTFGSGGYYKGTWVNNERHGEGEELFLNGDCYKGDFAENKMTGFGTFLFHNGERYEGQFRDGKKHGEGAYYYIDGCKYVGQWSDDQRNGKGKEWLPNGKIYEGDFENGKAHGNGKMIFKNGDWYEGQFELGQKVGKGTLYRHEKNIPGLSLSKGINEGKPAE